MKRVAMVVSTVGYHWEELFRAYWTFVDAGCVVELYTVDGSPAHPDPVSLRRTGPAAALGLGMPASIGPDTERGLGLLRVLRGVRALDELQVDRLDALFLPGGHGCLFDVNTNTKLHTIVAELFVRGVLLSGVCHATSTFSFVEVDGWRIVAGHEMTGFPHALDRTLIAAGLVHPAFLPLPLVNDEALRRAGAKLSRLDSALGCVNPRLVRTSLPFITGVGPKASGRVARAVVQALAAAEASAGAPKQLQAMLPQI